MKDLIIAATTRYTKEQLYNYVESINRCGFSGDKIMVVYDVDDDTIKEVYRKVAGKTHPDKKDGDDKMFKVANEANRNRDFGALLEMADELELDIKIDDKIGVILTSSFDEKEWGELSFEEQFPRQPEYSQWENRNN